MCCFECLLRCLGDIVRFVNRYALSISAIYGETYCDGVGILMDIFRSHSGIDLIINDDLVASLVLMGALVTGLFGSGVAALYVYAQDGTSDKQILLAAVGAALISFMIQAAVLSVLTTGVGTLYLCIALDPAVLRLNHPEYFVKIQNAWYSHWGHAGAHQVHLETRGRGYQQPPTYG
eukprot:TRINITY_DN2147_c0_g1_i2.p1 TRINITY_DN2147_c0_g1~~TRINITY_DN2147_c0_g1_i2.p1  ORF type:complete len:177 (-),score=22.96 TRINITY_DN2147_c0_g1_i2:77-607(-)